MEQLTQSLKDGTMEILEVPFPALNAGQVLVRNHYSLISAGTEGKTVRDARLGYIGKARARKEEVKKVIQTAKTIGFLETYRLVMNKLDAPSALGYSCAGEVIAVADDVRDFTIGDLVACGGASAVHAEVVAIPVNLCVKLSKDADLKSAAFSTVGAIALQGIRQADLRLAESCVVIGLGLIGQLTVLLLKAAGIKVIAIDIDNYQVQKAKQIGADLAIDRSETTLNDQISYFTEGYGADAVIITASSSSTDPIDLAGELCRKKGKVIIVGAVPTGFARKNYYVKELEIKMSCSYGPGRYDSEYEDGGLDYPYAYVRWTENRNMQAFTELTRSGNVNLNQIISHEFNFREAKKAYDMILEKKESFAGIVLKYDLNKELKSSIQFTNHSTSPQKVKIAFIGAGAFAQNMILPRLQKLSVEFTGITTGKANNSANIASKYGFKFSTDKAQDIFNDKNVNTVFITTRHDSHYSYVVEGIKNKKNVFVEKPLCMNEEELSEIIKLQNNSSNLLMVGFNRRFAPLVKKIKNSLTPSVPVSINYRINAGIVAADHWTQNPTIGGGRIIGEICHFIDLCRHIANSSISHLSAFSMKTATNTEDTIIINIAFENGSIATVSYFGNGPKELPKEQLEVFSAGTAYILQDFKSLTVYGKTKKVFTENQDKGHAQELVEFIDAINKGTKSPIAFEEIAESMLATFKTIQSIRNNGKSISIKDSLK